MENKILLQDLSAGMSKRSGLGKREGENFVRTFFSVIEQYLQEDKIVKVKGLGTFKVVEVSGRDSVNVNTGERIHIKGHSKVTFTPDSAIRDHVNRPFADFETIILNEGVDLAAMEFVDVPDDVTVRDDEGYTLRPEDEDVDVTLRPDNEDDFIKSSDDEITIRPESEGTSIAEESEGTSIAEESEETSIAEELSEIQETEPAAEEQMGPEAEEQTEPEAEEQAEPEAEEQTESEAEQELTTELEAGQGNIGEQKEADIVADRSQQAEEVTHTKRLVETTSSVMDDMTEPTLRLNDAAEPGDDLEITRKPSDNESDDESELSHVDSNSLEETMPVAGTDSTTSTFGSMTENIGEGTAGSADADSQSTDEVLDASDEKPHRIAFNPYARRRAFYDPLSDDSQEADNGVGSDLGGSSVSETAPVEDVRIAADEPSAVAADELAENGVADIREEVESVGVEAESESTPDGQVTEDTLNEGTGVTEYSQLPDEQLAEGNMPDAEETSFTALNDNAAPNAEEATAAVLNVVEEPALDSVSENVSSSDSTLPKEKASRRSSYVARHTSGRTADDTPSNKENKTNIFAAIGKLLLVIGLMVVSYFAGTNHLFDESCIRRSAEQSAKNEAALSNASETSAAGDAVVEEQQVVAEDSVDDVTEELADEELPQHVNIQNEELIELDDDESVDNSPQAGSRKRGSESNNSTAASAQSAASRQGESSASSKNNYPQVAGGEYEIVGVKCSYTLRKGESVSIVARKYYNDPKLSVYISKLNNLSNPDLVEVGQVIKVPELKHK